MKISTSTIPGPVLIVEDDQKMIDLVAHYLKKENIHALVA